MCKNIENPSLYSALVTGCSTGIGRATAFMLAHQGHHVWAGVRREKDAADLEKAWRDQAASPQAGSTKGGPSKSGSLRGVIMDVADPSSVQAAFAKILAPNEPPLRTVVNNAGYGQFGALEDLTEEEFRRQWEINVAGTWRVFRAALPTLRAGGSQSTIVNVSSILGRVAMPFGGPYAASKFAVEALSDALRVEVARWGVRVVVAEPGPIATQFNKNAMAAADFNRIGDSAYADIYKTLEAHYRRPNRAGELPPEAAAIVICKSIAKRRPRTRYLITNTAKMLAFVRRIVPDRVLDAMLARYLGL